MSDLPTGTVTFLFTDIEGSTALWEQHRDGMRQALVRHDVLVEQIVAEHDGHVVRPRGEGDSRFAVFARATDAVSAAAALQQALHAEPWPTSTPLRVRMAVHTGEGDLREGDYYGSTVNRCARLRAVAHGGQTLVSLATQELARDSLPADAALLDLGAHRLKDLIRPEHIFQLVVPGLQADFPALKSLDARPHNLPVQRDPLIGRERDVADIIALMRKSEIGLLTLTGPGGTGKTRLSLHVAAELLDDFTDGVWVVELTPITDPALVISSIAQLLDVKEVAGQSLLDRLKVYLREKQMLLVLDNFEQVVTAGSLISDLLKAAPRLKVLVTSREVLHVRGEQEYLVPALAVPDLRHRPPLEELTQYAAVALFIQRAQATKPDFQVTNASAPAVAEICVRLDGLPLAIELAAARVKMLPPELLLSRLSNRLKVLTGGARDLPHRQQTLRAAIDWSYELLVPAEQMLFARLAVFVGGYTLEAAESVCAPQGGLGLDVFDGLTSLVDRSLVRQQEGADGEPRFTMLETLREYGVERLLTTDKAETVRRQHAIFFLALAEAGVPTFTGDAPGPWLQQIAVEQDNIRTALRWFVERRELEMGMRMVGALWPWYWREAPQEGLRWAEELLAQPHGEEHTIARARVLFTAGILAWGQRNYALARARIEQSIAIYREQGDRRGLAEAGLWWAALQLPFAGR